MQTNGKDVVEVRSPQRKRVVSFDFTAGGENDDDDLDIDVKSSTNSDGSLIEVDGTDRASQAYTAERASVKSIRKKTPVPESFLSKLDHPVEKDTSRTVYDYAAIVHQKSDESRQNRLNEDVTAVLGSSDPPAGFGVLHPRIHYLKQSRPFPLDPLPVWRGYNGNIYFSPIQVQRLEGDRQISYAKSLVAASTSGIQSRAKTQLDQSNAAAPLPTNRKSTRERNNHRRQALAHRKVTTINNEFKNQRVHTPHNLIEDQEPVKPWHSFFTTSPTRRKSTQQSTEDSTAEKSRQNRLVLPSIRPAPKPRVVHKGLAYKESQKTPRTLEEQFTEPPVSLLPTATAVLPKDQIPLDLREIRKRIVRGPTTFYRTPAQSMAWSPRSTDQARTTTIELILPAATIESSKCASGSSASSRYQHKRYASYPTPTLAEQNVDVS